MVHKLTQRTTISDIDTVREVGWGNVSQSAERRCVPGKTEAATETRRDSIPKPQLGNRVN